MCGRLDLSPSPAIDGLLDRLHLPHYPHTTNAAPTEDVPVIFQSDDLQLHMMHWWLTPRWVKERSQKFAMLNARSENLTSSPAFRESYERRRCVVPVAGFYEWLREGKQTYPYRLTTEDQPMLLAGIYDIWQRNGAYLESFAIVTTVAVHTMQWLHNRQPVFIPEARLETWLNPQSPLDDVAPFLAPHLPYPLIATPVSRSVGNARFKGEIPAAGEAERIET